MYTGRQLKNEAGNKVSRQMECGTRQLVQIRDERKTFVQQYPSIHFISKVSKPNDKMQTLSQMYNGLHTPIARPMTIQMLNPFIRGLLKGSAAGAILGSILPGIGDLIGGAVGAITIAKELIEAQKRKRIAKEKGITISDDISGFILAKVEDVLKILPLAHLKGNESLQHIKKGDNDMGNASSYDYESTINILNPLGMPDFLYALLSKKPNWMRTLMDRGSVEKGDSFSYGDERKYSSIIDQKYNLNSSSRAVMAGVSDANSQEKLLSWTLRHEIGHSVDKQIHWQDDYSKETMFGGWEIIKGEDFLDKILEMVSVDKKNVTFKTIGNKVISPMQFLSALIFRSRGIIYDVSINITGEDGKNKQILEKIERKCFLAFNHPWMFKDGCIDDLLYDNKIYMYDEYGDPCSYRADQREYAVSNYQFAAAKEWFAEAYAAFYNPVPNAPSRERLSDEVKRWFVTNLGEHYSSGKINSPAAFITKEGILTAAYKKCAYYLHEYTKGYASIQDSNIWYAAIDIMNLDENDWKEPIIAYKIYELTKSNDSTANYYAACNLKSNSELQAYKKEIDNGNKK